MMTAARTMGACNGCLLRRLLRTVLVLSLASLRLALANGDDVHLPALLAELKHRGYPRHGGHAVFLGDAGPWLPFLQQNHVAPVSAAELRAIPDESVDLAVVGRGAGVDFGLVDRVLKVGGVAAVFAASRSALELPGNYKVAAVIAPRSEKNEGAVAAEKTGASTGGSAAIARRHHRKLLAAPGNKEDVLDGLEGVLLEPPQRRHAIRRLRPKYLPELTGDSLEGYRRRVFIDVAPAPGGGAASWFRKHYPRGRHEFESVRLTAAGEAAEGIGDWLEGNVGEEDYVVVKAGVEAAEEMLRKGAAVVRRVDELFLDCGEGGRGAAGNGNLGRRPYWQCLALYGRLRDQGVAVHQWWSGMLR
ncbi:unnamed protein product [Urochloa decumbens]|uniref:DUF7870 domain-containing protein n=1 Tax=Urochloa decumbens TaxID=240449 RepID=A0ABC9G077_9POAL